MTLLLELISESGRGRAIKRWVYLGPQGWLLCTKIGYVLFMEKLFQVSKETFDYACELVVPDLQRQNSRFRSAVSLTKHIAIALWRIEPEIHTERTKFR